MQLIKQDDTIIVRVFESDHSPATSSQELYPRLSELRPKQAPNSTEAATPSSSRIPPDPCSSTTGVNYVPGKFADLKVDVLYLGIGVLGKQSDAFREAYWREAVEVMRPGTVIPIH
jgi:hypothetical protein